MSRPTPFSTRCRLSIGLPIASVAFASSSRARTRKAGRAHRDAAAAIAFRKWSPSALREPVDDSLDPLARHQLCGRRVGR